MRGDLSTSCRIATLTQLGKQVCHGLVAIDEGDDLGYEATGRACLPGTPR